MSKAYDRVEWAYLHKVLHKMGFNKRWIKIIMNYVTTVRYSFNINSRIMGNLKPSRGLRQGDPLSPYLFVICTQGLSTILEYERIHGGLQGLHMASGSPMITHLFFANDSLVFFKATKENTDLIKNYLSRYERASG